MRRRPSRRPADPDRLLAKQDRQKRHDHRHHDRDYNPRSVHLDQSCAYRAAPIGAGVHRPDEQEKRRRYGKPQGHRREPRFHEPSRPFTAATIFAREGITPRNAAAPPSITTSPSTATLNSP